MNISLEEAKSYLRVDTHDDDILIENIIVSAEVLCMDICRLDTLDGIDDGMIRMAMLYAIAYLYEHREEADHKKLVLSLRSLLFGFRREGF